MNTTNDRYWVLDEKGEAVSVGDDCIAWAKAFEKADRVIAKTQMADAEVSTVFLGLDHSFGDGPPLIFETMIFGGNHADHTERYSTRSEAIEGHARCVELVRATIFP